MKSTVIFTNVYKIFNNASAARKWVRQSKMTVRDAEKVNNSYKFNFAFEHDGTDKSLYPRQEQFSANWEPSVPYAGTTN